MEGGAENHGQTIGPSQENPVEGSGADCRSQTGQGYDENTPHRIK